MNSDYQSGPNTTAPAIALMITSAIGMLYSLGNILIYILMLANVLDNCALSSMPQYGDAEAMRFGQNVGYAMPIAIGTINLFVWAFCMFAGIQTHKKKMHTLCMIGFIAPMIIGILSCCQVGSICCMIPLEAVSLGIGIWGLIILFNEDVKMQFQRNM